MIFSDRREAGQLLAEQLRAYHGTGAVVLALPRGGVIVGCEIARVLRLSLDVLITRKIGAPANLEYAIGAISEGSEPQFNESELAALGVSNLYLEREVAAQRQEIERRAALYRGGRGLAEVGGRTVILADDGIATGFTVFASIRALRTRNPTKIVLAVPVAPPSTLKSLRREVDELYCLATPEPFYAVGAWYGSFDQVTDGEVQSALLDCSQPPSPV
ncbi:MAG: phosphoribosyltransferase [Chloroflexota bacterium]